MKDYFLLKNSAAFLNFEKACKKNELSHCYLILGEDTSAAAFAKLMLCAIYCKNNPVCFVCPDCVRAENFYNFNILALPKEGEKLDNAAIELVLEKSSLKPSEQGIQAFLLQNFHTLQEKVQNKLLKTLEEPCENTIFILTCQNIRQVLPTVLSRAVKIELENFSAEQIEKQLTALFPEKLQKIKYAATLCEGNLGKAEKIVSDNGFDEIFSLANDFMQNYVPQKFVHFSNRASKISDKIPDLFELLLLMFRDSLLKKNCLENYLLFSDYEFCAFAHLTKMQLIDIIEQLSKTKKMFLQNVNKQMIFDRFLINLGNLH